VAGASLALVCTLDRADEKFLPLAFAAATARELGAVRVGLVAPYLGYMRQDARFAPGEAVTSRLFAAELSRAVDWLVTVDPHLHRHRALGDIYSVPARAVHAAPLLSAWIAANIEAPIVIGPDDESEQWAASIAAPLGVPHLVMHKARRGDADVEVALPKAAPLAGRTPVLVDDIIASGRTLIAAAAALRAAGVPAAACLGIHAVFAGDAHSALTRAGLSRIVTTNTIPHATNALDASALVAAAMRGLATA
jgi:ribose-phosphate pyrophosphokinase